MLGLAAPGFGLWPLAWIGLIPALWALLQCQSAKQAFGQGLLWGSVYFGVLFSWFFGLHPITWIGFSEGASLAITIAGWVVMWLTQGIIIGLVWGSLYVLKSYTKFWLFLFLAPVLWIALYWFINLNPIGLPWGFLTYSQAPVDWVRQAAFPLRFWGVEYFIFFTNVAFFYLLAFKSKRFLIGFVWLFFALAFWLSGSMGSPSLPKSPLRDLNPVIIQGNIPLDVERRLMTQADKERYYQKLIQQALQQIPKTQLIVLPEGIVSLKGQNALVPFKMPDTIALFTGGTYQDKGLSYNGALLYQPGKPVQKMAKRYLVPFGETTPFISEDWLVPTLNRLGIAYFRGFSRAPMDQPLFQLGSARIGTFVCFEALYPNINQVYRTKGVDMLVTFSNLGWYQGNDLLKKQFLAINQFRAAEAGVPLILATNTGISAFISERGNILSQAQSDVMQWLVVCNRNQTCKAHEKLPGNLTD